MVLTLFFAYKQLVNFLNTERCPVGVFWFTSWPGVETWRPVRVGVTGEGGRHTETEHKISTQSSSQSQPHPRPGGGRTAASRSAVIH